MLILDQLKRGDRPLQRLAVAILVGMAILLVGLWYVQVVTARRYQASLQTQSFRTVRLPAVRGRILDHDGQVLAENRPSYDLNLYLEELSPAFKREFARVRAGRRMTRAERQALEPRVRYAVASNVVARLGAVLQQPLELSEAQFRRHYHQRLVLPLTVADNLEPVQIARYFEHSSLPPGVDLEIEPRRFYPQGTLASHLLGYLHRDESGDEDEDMYFHYRLPDYRGAVGVEAGFDDQLRGRAGVKSVLVNNLGYRQSETIWAPTEPGRTAVLTLNLGIQRAAEKALASAGPGLRGAVVVMDPGDGDVLALASAPTFDPNLFLDAIPSAVWQQLNDPKQRPLFNRATQGAYPPGSIFKMITALACFEAGVVRPGDTISNPGYYRLGRRTIGDLAPPGDYDFRRAFKKSSNTYFIHFGLKAGLSRVLEMGHRFCLGRRADLPTRQEVSGYFPQASQVLGWWTEGNAANVCIGQEITVTPLQMAVVTSAIANGGNVLYPRLVERIEPVDPSAGAETNYLPPRLRATLGVNPRHLELLREGMLADVEDTDESGTGHAARVPGFRVAGKTGTAEIKGRGVVDRITWFVSFGPFEAPRYVVVVMVESGVFGGVTCAPIARQIFEYIHQTTRRSGPGGRLAGSP